ncbi:MAG TPA: molybdate ABC transporter substrate-binding protein [Dissulfurispiraceae bacterium]|nr:molybdate ABC transporter substrate-binding protein [Dissulfurispiraceae bacterium]
MFKKIVLAFIVVTAFLSSSLTFAEPPKEITVSAAISLKNAFEEIGKIYEAKNRETKVFFNFGASGDLMRQIEGGAPVDVFASAARQDMDEAEKKGLIAIGSRVNFAANSVVLIVPLKEGNAIKSFKDLKSGSVKKIAVGNPKAVPAGRYTEEVLKYYKILDAIKDKLIFTENVRQVLDYVFRGEVDAGIVYSTDAIVGAKEVVAVATAPEASHRPVVYPIAMVKASPNSELASGFIGLVTSPEGKRILAKYGFKDVQ